MVKDVDLGWSNVPRRLTLKTSSQKLEEQVAWKLNLKTFCHWNSVKVWPMSLSHLSIWGSLVKKVLFCSKM